MRDDAQADAARWGITLGPARIEADGVWPEHVKAVRAFLAVSTQWRRFAFADGRIGTVGLDYGAVAAGLRLARIRVKARLWHQVRQIEAGAMDEMNGAGR